MSKSYILYPLYMNFIEIGVSFQDQKKKKKKEESIYVLSAVYTGLQNIIATLFAS